MNLNPRIKDLAEKDRPRERLALEGPEAVSSAELVAILLRTGLRGYSALDISRQSLARFQTLDRLARASLEELCVYRMAASSFRGERQGEGYEGCFGEATLTDASWSPLLSPCTKADAPPLVQRLRGRIHVTGCEVNSGQGTGSGRTILLEVCHGAQGIC